MANYKLVTPVTIDARALDALCNCLSKLDSQVYWEVLMHPESNVDDIVERISGKKSRVQDSLWNLETYGMIKSREDDNKGSVYYLVGFKQ